ncbi:MAG: bifunctional phosphoribosylaminoimidazolecarboxamide formyltransferase/IMP cyclohydrolase [Chitinispirillaceae bacterium]
MKPTVIKRVLISVSDKTGVVEFARSLARRGVEILSTGGTYKKLRENGIEVMTVDSYTGHPEIMDGRVKTLHPRVHGGILGVRDNAEHMKAMEENGIKPIDMIVVNLYPFQQTIARPDVTIGEAIENIDIGGPTMVRSAAKNHAYVTVVVDPADYNVIVEEMEQDGAVSFTTRKRLAVKAFRHTADYDSGIDTYLSKVYMEEEVLRLSYSEGVELRYGENPHQKATFYKDKKSVEPSLANGRQLNGKGLSYNNIVDGDAALEAVKELADVPASAIIKHTNPCGYATGTTLDEALGSAWSGDPVSAFGSVIAVSRTVDLKAAEVLSGRFVEMIIAPGYDADALEFLKKKSSALRVIEVGDLKAGEKDTSVLKHVTGGILRQDRDGQVFGKMETVTRARFPSSKQKLAGFAYRACKHVKSNAIVLAQEYQEGLYRIIGIGAGQPNRVDALRKLAVTKARENLSAEYTAADKQLPPGNFEEFGEFVMASDAFFPFADTIEEANAVGIRYIVQPGGSKRDGEVIEACDKFGIAMAFTGMRHFRH